MEDKKLKDQELDLETLNKANHTRAHQGKQPYLRFNNFRNNKPSRGGQGVPSGNPNRNQQNRED